MAEGPFSLYDHPHFHRDLFPMEAGQVDFFARALGGCPVPLVDLGCGDGGLGRALGQQHPGALVVGLDLSRKMLGAGEAAVAKVRGDLLRLPLGEECAGGLVSRLFGVAYAHGSSPKEGHRLAREVGRIARPGARAALELPVAWEPRRLQGIAETYSAPEGWDYVFHYFDVVRETPFGFVLQTRINLLREGRVYSIEAPLHVYTIAGVREWHHHGGLRVESFHAPYDWESGTDSPPPDCLRAVVVSVKGM